MRFTKIYLLIFFVDKISILSGNYIVICEHTMIRINYLFEFWLKYHENVKVVRY